MADILLIDDMKGVRRSVSTVLKRAGHNVTEAEEGGAGLELLKGGTRFVSRHHRHADAEK